jgi:hypothetical protein
VLFKKLSWNRLKKGQYLRVKKILAKPTSQFRNQFTK